MNSARRPTGGITNTELHEIAKELNLYECADYRDTTLQIAPRSDGLGYDVVIVHQLVQRYIGKPGQSWHQARDLALTELRALYEVGSERAENIVTESSAQDRSIPSAGTDPLGPPTDAGNDAATKSNPSQAAETITEDELTYIRKTLSAKLCKGYPLQTAAAPGDAPPPDGQGESITVLRQTPPRTESAREDKTSTPMRRAGNANSLNPLGGLGRLPDAGEYPDDLSPLVLSISRKLHFGWLDASAENLFRHCFFDLDAASQKQVALRQNVDMAQRFDELVRQEREMHERILEPCRERGLTNNDAPHELVRGAIASLLEHTVPCPKQIRMALALSAHPWPDDPVSDSALDAIAAEMLPSRNLRHPDPRELAIDRMLRIAEALEYETETDLAARFREAADRVQALSIPKDDTETIRRLPNHQLTIMDSLSVNPLGITTGQASPPVRSGAEDLDSPSEAPKIAKPCDPDLLHETIAQLQGAAAAADSSDIGVIHGGEPTGISVEQIARALGIGLPLHSFDQRVDALNSRDRDVLTSRTYTLDTPDTLGSVAKRWGISRARIQQSEKAIREKFDSAFAKTLIRIGGPLLNRYRATIVRTRTLHEAALSLSAGCKWQVAAAAAILDAVGPWRDFDGWALHASIESRFNCLRKQLQEAADAYGLLTDGRVEEVLAGLFDDESEQETFLLETLCLGKTFGLWTIRDTLRCKVAATLRYLGRPATKEEIADLLLLPHDRVSSTLGTLEGVVRSDRYRWGFDDWVEDPYDGIVGEIRQRIDDHGGSVPVSVILEEVPSRFDVTEASVRAYLGTDAFVVEDEIVRHATADDYSPRAPDSCPGAIQINGVWGQRLRLYDRHFAGYSLGVSFDIAYANGVRPGDDLLVGVVGHDYQASLIWRSHSLNRLIDVGRISDLVKSLGYVVEDEIIVIPTQNSVEILGVGDIPEALVPTGNREFEAITGERGSDASDESLGQRLNDPLLDLLGDGL